MTTMKQRGFFSGVVEGFYGQPWSGAQRRRLFGWMEAWGLDTYLYAPKDDVKHRTRWRELYTAAECRELRGLIAACRRRGVRFCYAIGPGLDLRYAGAGDREWLFRKIDQVWDLGCRHVALLFDDIPSELRPTDRRRFLTFAAAQSDVANDLGERMRSRDPDSRLLFCPTVYCGRMAVPSVRESSYLGELGERLDPSILVLWTGNDIVSETISVASIREWRLVVRRKPVIWDNLHANDYDRRRLYLGPYAGRALSLREEVAGILSNPNCEFEANRVPLRTLGGYVRARGRWNPRRAYRDALVEWLPEWDVHGSDPITVEELELLGDCLYLPREAGTRARNWLSELGHLVTNRSTLWGGRRDRFIATCMRLERLYEKMTALRDRALLHVFYRHIWDLKEEAALMRAYVTWMERSPAAGAVFRSPHHRPGIYRGGVVAELQRLVPMDRDGGFRPFRAGREGVRET
jgi:protein O-GlcNAcase/histone acetyltransferase